MTPVRLSEWVSASADARAQGVAQCLATIASADLQIQAWVQIAPEPPTGAGALDGIPFGAKDIMETRALATEYGSSIYRGRTGADDAEIVSESRGSSRHSDSSSGQAKSD